MTYLVPFDDSELSRTALARAVDLAGDRDHEVVVYTVLPGDREYAVERGWVRDDDAFDPDDVAERLRASAIEIAPSATVECEQVGRYTRPGQIANRIRARARAVDAEVVFIGSENAGRIVRPVSSVGGTVAAEDAYDVYIVPSVQGPGR